MIQISATIITFNEEYNIARCIESLLPVADEIIVLDSFSTDKTETICKQYPMVRFYQHPFEGHIEQKNRALSFAKYDYILSLDADESLTDALQRSLLQVKQNPDFLAYNVNRRNFFCGTRMRHLWYPDRKLRFWNKQYGQWGGQNPHDRVTIKPSITVKHLRGDLLHFTFRSIEEHITQINKFSTIKAEVSFNRNEKLIIVKMLLKPFLKFLKDYFLSGGILDGFYGFVISINSAHSTFLKYAKLRRLYTEKKS